LYETKDLIQKDGLCAPGG